MSSAVNPLVAVVKTGVANTASVLSALRRAGGDPELTVDARAVSEAPFAVLPGVGAFGAAMEAIEETGLTEPLRNRINEGRPTLCICLGLQLLFSASEESPGVRGLAVLEDTIERFPPGLRVPQLGWNRVTPKNGSRYLREGFAYFANSYSLMSSGENLPAGWSAATTDYGVQFTSAFERQGVLACQFHPELSGEWGEELIGRWLEESKAFQRGAR